MAAEGRALADNEASGTRRRRSRGGAATFGGRPARGHGRESRCASTGTRAHRGPRGVYQPGRRRGSCERHVDRRWSDEAHDHVASSRPAGCAGVVTRTPLTPLAKGAIAKKSSAVVSIRLVASWRRCGTAASRRFRRGSCRGHHRGAADARSGRGRRATAVTRWPLSDKAPRQVWAALLDDDESPVPDLHDVPANCRPSTAKQQTRRDQLTVHADRGSSKASTPVAYLLADLGVTKSHARPRRSNDNRYHAASPRRTPAATSSASGSPTPPPSTAPAPRRRGHRPPPRRVAHRPRAYHDPVDVEPVAARLTAARRPGPPPSPRYHSLRIGMSIGMGDGAISQFESVSPWHSSTPRPPSTVSVPRPPNSLSLPPLPCSVSSPL